MEHSAKCFARHMGPWLIEPGFLESALAAYRDGRDPVAARRTGGRTADGDELYAMAEGGVAVIPIVDVMAKGSSKFGTDTVMTRRAVRTAAADKAVRCIVLTIDSPGGTVRGTADLARDVYNVRNRKPVLAQIDDEAASAAVWVASQATEVAANPTAQVGSIGVMTVIEDTSGAAEFQRRKVHVVASGPYKGVGVDGAPVTDEQLAYIQSRVDELSDHFVAAVAEGRSMPTSKVRELATGRMWGATAAQTLGLVDTIRTMDETLARAAEIGAATAAGTKRRLIDARLRMAGLDSPQKHA